MILVKTVKKDGVLHYYCPNCEIWVKESETKNINVSGPNEVCCPGCDMTFDDGSERFRELENGRS